MRRRRSAGVGGAARHRRLDPPLRHLPLPRVLTRTEPRGLVTDVTSAGQQCLRRGGGSGAFGPINEMRSNAMKRTSFLRLAVGITAVVVTATAVIHAPAGAKPQQPSEPGGEFVVAFADGNEGAARGRSGAAGGTVVDVNEAANMALVERHAVRSSEDPRRGRASLPWPGTTRSAPPGRACRTGSPRSGRRHAMRASVDAAELQEPRRRATATGAEPLADLQWDMAMIGATPDGAHRQATGRGRDGRHHRHRRRRQPSRHRAQLQPPAVAELHDGHPCDRRPV